MAAHGHYTIQKRIATAVGVGIIGYSGALTWEHSHDIAAPIAAVVGAGMFHFGEIGLRSRRWISGLVFGLLGLLAVLISLNAVISRESSRYDSKVEAAQSENLTRHQAKATLEVEQKALDVAEAAATAECKSGVGPRCKGLEARADAARKRVAEARDKLSKLGALKTEDPAAKRIAAVLGVPEASVGLVTPLMLPIWLELSGIALLQFGLSPSEAVVSSKRKRKAKSRLKWPKGLAKLWPKRRRPYQRRHRNLTVKRAQQKLALVK